MTARTIQVDGVRWRARALSEEVLRKEADSWHWVRVRFDPPAESTGLLPRRTWLRLEEDVPADDVLDQYRDAELVEAFLTAEEIDEGPSPERTRDSPSPDRTPDAGSDPGS